MPLLLQYRYPFNFKTYPPVRFILFFFGVQLPSWEQMVEHMADKNYIFEDDPTIHQLTMVEKWFYLIVTLHFREIIFRFNED